MTFDFDSTTYISDLTPRERQVADLIAQGYTNAQIAADLSITRETVKTHVSNILSKLGLTSRLDVSSIFSAAQKE